MADQAKDMADIEAEMDWEDAQAIARKVVEMCDRCAAAGKIVPGGQARWFLEIDGVRFRLTVEVADG